MQYLSQKTILPIGGSLHNYVILRGGWVSPMKT